MGTEAVRRATKHLCKMATMWIILCVVAALGSGAVAGSCSECEGEIVSALNAYRLQQGVGELKVDPEMDAFATDWARVMAETGDKEHSDQTFGGENIASSMGAYTDSAVAAGFMAQWTKSAGHNANMLGAGWECVGVGVWSSNGGRDHDGVQVFGPCGSGASDASPSGEKTNSQPGVVGFEDLMNSEEGPVPSTASEDPVEVQSTMSEDPAEVPNAVPDDPAAAQNVMADDPVSPRSATPEEPVSAEDAAAAAEDAETVDDMAETDDDEDLDSDDGGNGWWYTSGGHHWGHRRGYRGGNRRRYRYGSNRAVRHRRAPQAAAI